MPRWYVMTLLGIAMVSCCQSLNIFLGSKEEAIATCLMISLEEEWHIRQKLHLRWKIWPF